MGRGIVVDYGGEVSSFGLTKVEREKLYGRRKKVVVDENGQDCSQAILTRDGTALLPAGCTASLYLNDAFEVCERGDLQAVGHDGAPLPEVESTLGVPTQLDGPIEASRLLDHIAKSVYELDPEELGQTLRELLEKGDIFETRFNYRKGYDDSPAFILQNEEGIFAIVGEPTEFEYLRNENATANEAEDEDEDPFDDDLDFSF